MNIIHDMYNIIINIVDISEICCYRVDLLIIFMMNCLRNSIPFNFSFE